jgi:hypothetical protein
MLRAASGSAKGHQFSVTSGTIFASRKLPVRDYLAAICIFVNAVKGVSALQLGRDLDIQYKSAFVLCHKLREAVGSIQNQGELSGVVEIDGAYVGGHVRQENVKADRTDRRLEVPAKRQSVVVARERGGRTLVTVVAKEADGAPFVRQRVILLAPLFMPMRRLAGIASTPITRCAGSTIRSYSKDGACTNQAESYFSRLRRAEWGQHHHISGKYLSAYAVEMAWREDNRRKANGALHEAATGAALAHPISRAWAGYWQRNI